MTVYSWVNKVVLVELAVNCWYFESASISSGMIHWHVPFAAVNRPPSIAAVEFICLFAFSSAVPTSCSCSSIADAICHACTTPKSCTPEFLVLVPILRRDHALLDKSRIMFMMQHNAVLLDPMCSYRSS